MTELKEKLFYIYGFWTIYNFILERAWNNAYYVEFIQLQLEFEGSTMEDKIGRLKKDFDDIYIYTKE